MQADLCPLLERLDIHGCRGLTDDILYYLSMCHALAEDRWVAPTIETQQGSQMLITPTAPGSA